MRLLMLSDFRHSPLRSQCRHVDRGCVAGSLSRVPAARINAF